MVVDEYVTKDNDLPVAEALGADREDTRLLRFKEGQSDASESAGDSEADEEQVDYFRRGRAEVGRRTDQLTKSGQKLLSCLV